MSWLTFLSLSLQETHLAIYQAIKRAFFHFFGFPLQVNIGMQDHCEAAMNAKLLAWPGFGFFSSSAVAIRGHFVCLAGIVVNNCYPHAVRMVARATRSRLRNSNNGARLRSHFSMLHALTILAVFQHAMMLFYSFWRTNERAFIEWFEQTYDHDGRWLGWFAENLFRTQQLLVQKYVCKRPFFFWQVQVRLASYPATRALKGFSTSFETVFIVALLGSP